MSVNFDGSVIDIIETHQQFYHGCFTGTGRSDNGNFLSLFDFGTEIMNDDLIVFISEMNMLKRNISDNVVNTDRIFNNLAFFFLVEEFKNTFCCRSHGLYLVCNLGNLLYRLGKVFHILDKCLNITNLDSPFDCQKPSNQSNSCIA